MEATLSSQSTIRTLQKDVIDLLTQVSDLMQRASVSLESDAAQEKYVGFQQEINSAAKNVKELELRMAIVAPMSAGKSTIINAIVGQDLLPSRNSAMTTLPTEIIFNRDLSEPILTLSDELLCLFQKSYSTLKSKLQATTLEWMQEKLAQYPHLVALGEKIQGAGSFQTQPKISGCVEISRALTRLNDIIRLCSLIELADPLERLTELPRIETPFWRSPNADQSELLGHLVIIDTPGPNEASDKLRLSEIVDEELKNSSIVLIVLDFTQLKTETAEKVKEDVQRVIALRGKESLYVLVNKVDQRSDIDMTADEVRQFVEAEFGIVDSINTNRVFEVSARRAFYATNFQLELQQNSTEINVTEMQSARTLAKQAFGDCWELMFQDATIAKMQAASEHVWQKSGFEPFLKDAISALMQNAAPRCMRFALTLSRQHLETLKKEVLTRIAGMAKEFEELQKEIDRLELELVQLKDCRQNRLKEVERIKADLQSKLNSIFETLRKEAQVGLQEYFGEQLAGSSEKINDYDFFKRAGAEFKRLFDIFQGKSSVDTKIVKFRSALEAEECIDLALAYAKRKVEALLVPRRSKIEREVKQSCRDLAKKLESDTKEIIERACKRLNRTFNIDLSPPPVPEWNPLEFQRVQSTRNTEYRTEYKTVKERPWYLLWIIEIKKQVPITVTDAYYTVSLDELVATNNESIKNSLDHISQELIRYLDGDYQAYIDLYFDALDTLFQDYQKILARSQEDTRLSQDGKESLTNELKGLLKETDQEIGQVTFLSKGVGS